MNAQDAQTATSDVQRTENDLPQRTEAYRAPRVVTLGKAVGLVQQNSVGYNLDGPATVSRTYY